MPLKECSRMRLENGKNETKIGWKVVETWAEDFAPPHLAHGGDEQDLSPFSLQINHHSAINSHQF